ncbi:hypothetical protein KHS38_03600 [Mucilaginibacter sp. Bleaf8]|uniref:hypothetical protein n=1 Tax=Mucilaginibacter sp. Bleaf8 TaxID=2834430 RepID=UPI001BD19D8F|nr:hypothetical protein [Mucilaginibacter sp. Bleaf8]MBS7563480.1 hypothetical protein [Mucilaginibacter sp. Bleaf8]
MFKKRSLLSKLWLKYSDRPKYKLYKWELGNYKVTEYTNFLLGAERLTSINAIKALTDTTKQLNVTHSGNAGDIIYALPTLKKIHEITGAAINLYFILGKPLKLLDNYTHPLGNVMLNKNMSDMLIPLIEQQAYIQHCGVYTDQKVHIDLDYFRAGLIQLDKGNIARWCGYITGVNPTLWQSWLTVTPLTDFKDTIVVARSSRYRNKLIDYSFLKKYPTVKFIGVKDEFEDMKRILPDLEWIQVENFLELAKVIAGCKLFIGNQSFPYSVAEALKVPRILEVCFEVINVVPEGENAYDFLFQDHFEYLVNYLYELS